MFFNKVFLIFLGLCVRTHNFFIDLFFKRKFIPSDLPELNEIRNFALQRNEINDHLETLFIESLTIKPKLIVELGVGSGKSNYVLERVAKLCDAQLISVDIEDCSNVSSSDNWIFIQKDDIEFALEFENWCKKHSIEPKIDVLFIDTSHLYEHTIQEIKYWFPFLTDRAKVFFHDTNLGLFYSRSDRSIGTAWINQRGVIKALEIFFEKSFNEKKDFLDIRNGWLIKHHSACNGFTILQRLPY